MKPNVPVILASASPRRAQLLQQMGLTFTILPSEDPELSFADNPADYVCDLAAGKAASVYGKIRSDSPDCLVIGADTIVYYDHEILGKPEDTQEAFDMLKLLADRTHQVYTGVCVILNGTPHCIVSRTDVTFYPITDEDLHAYITSGDCMDKAGAYGIQGPFARHVKEIHGDYNNVVGLPISALYQLLLQLL